MNLCSALAWCAGLDCALQKVHRSAERLRARNSRRGAPAADEAAVPAAPWIQELASRRKCFRRIGPYEESTAPDGQTVAHWRGSGSSPLPRVSLSRAI